MEIKKTNRYGQFTILDQNRELNEHHVRELINSIQEGNLLQFNPIIVNREMEIIDGQHRLEAAKRLKLDVYYVVAEASSIKDTRLLNRANKQWKLIDFVNSFAEAGNKEVKILKDFMEEFELTPSLALEMISGSYDRTIANRLRKGIVVIKDMEKAIDTANKLMLLQPHCEERLKTRNMVRAILHMDESKIDFGKLLAKLEQSDIQIKRTHNYRELLRQFEDALNYHMKTNTTRLY